MSKDTYILSLGDCNTIGLNECKENSYPEKVAEALNIKYINAGFTMSTTNEMLHLFKDNFSSKVCLVTIQFGLVDSWKTFKYSPYVLYYPDNYLRKIYRKLVKKYKKLTKSLGLEKIFGQKYVVKPEDYKNKVRHIIKTSNKPVFLIDTVPNKELFRNESIMYFNSILEQLSTEYANCYYVKLFDEFYKNMDNYLMIDGTHVNADGYEFITKKIIKKIHETNIQI